MEPLTPVAGYYAVTATVQLALGLAIVVKQPRREWAWIIGTLFVVNAADLVALLGQDLSVGLRRDAFQRTHQYFDMASFFCLAYFSLAFPRRPRFLARPGVLTALIALPAVVVFYLLATHNPAVQYPRGYETPITLTTLTLGWFLPAVVWITLLARFTYAWAQPMGPFLRRQFQFVFAAFAMRATTALTTTLVVSHKANSPAWALQAAQAMAIAPFLVLLGCIVRLLVLQARNPPAERNRTLFVLAFIFIGFILVFLSSIVSDTFSYRTNPLISFDLVVVRPTLIWYAMVRYQFLGDGWRQGWIGSALLGLLSTATLTAFIEPFFTNLFTRDLQGHAAAALPLALLVAGLTSGLVLYLARPWLGTSPGKREDGPVEAYVAALEEEFRNGEPNAADLQRLEATRLRLGVTNAQHEALLQAVRSRWSSSVGVRDWHPGETLLGRYRVESFLGEGTFGEAYLAFDILDDSQVVLKRTRRAQADARRVLLREAATLGRLDHPHIVSLVRTERAGDEPILVLEHLPGGSLATRLERGPLKGEELQRLARELLWALEAAHEAGITHRDLKPSNVLFGRDGSAHLADFGNVVLTAGPVRLGDPTASHSRAGTLRYMSPEQVRGQAASPRSDLYALGILLIEAATGEHPVPDTWTDYQIRQAIAEGPAPDVPDVVPEPLRSAIQAAVEREPRKRPASARSMLTMILPRRVTLGVGPNRSAAQA